MKQILLGVFYRADEPNHWPTYEQAEKLKQMLSAAGIPAEIQVEGNVDWDGVSYPNGRSIFLAVPDAEAERAAVLVKSAQAP